MDSVKLINEIEVLKIEVAEKSKLESENKRLIDSINRLVQEIKEMESEY
jgi:hypothetical protein